jgi:hypothetical protein
MVASVEQHIEWITDSLRYLRDKQLRQIEAHGGAERSGRACHSARLADETHGRRARVRFDHPPFRLMPISIMMRLHSSTDSDAALKRVRRTGV